PYVRPCLRDVQAKEGRKRLNLLSQGIVNDDGTPGRNYYTLGAQYSAIDKNKYQISPDHKMPYSSLPMPLAGGATTNSDTSAPFNTLAQAKKYENGLPDDYYVYL